MLFMPFLLLCEFILVEFGDACWRTDNFGVETASARYGGTDTEKAESSFVEQIGNALTLKNIIKLLYC